MMRRRRGDAALAARLRALPVPDHADDFFDRLRAQLIQESESQFAESATVIDLSVRRSAPPAPHRLARAGRWATAPAVAVACFALVVGGAVFARRVTGTDRPEVASVTAARDFSDPRAARLIAVKPASTTTPSTPVTMGLRVKFRTWSLDEKRLSPEYTYDAVISPTGDYHLSRQGASVNFDALTGARTIAQSEEGSSLLLTETDTPVGPPDARGPLSPTGALSRDLGAAVLAIAAERPDEVTRTQVLGRAALKHTFDNPGGILFKSQELTVDVATRIPLQLKQVRADGTTLRTLDVDSISEIAITDTVVAPALPATDTTSPAASQRFRPTDLDEVLATLPYQPLAPLWAPAGYSLAKVSRADSLEPVKDQKNPPYADVVAMLYSKDNQSFTVTTRRVTPGIPPAQWRDPFLDGTGLLDQTQIAAVETGALAGDTLHVGIQPVVWPHVWAQHGNIIVTVAGDLTREELLRVTESLAVYTVRSR